MKIGFLSLPLTGHLNPMIALARNLTAPQLSELIAKVITNPAYRDKARWFQKVLAKTRGLDVAADIIERALGKHLEAKAKEAVAANSFSSQDDKWKNI
jgi:UDP:flavonoid glycosyltransferase YjiC (YdhE family)